MFAESLEEGGGGEGFLEGVLVTIAIHPPLPTMKTKRSQYDHPKIYAKNKKGFNEN